MRQEGAPARYAAPGDVNAAADLFDNAERRPDHVAVARWVGGQWREVTPKDFADAVWTLAARRSDQCSSVTA